MISIRMQGRCRAGAACAAVLLAAAIQPAHAQPESGPCGSLSNAFGPYDYRTDRGSHLNLVEAGHFTPEVENLIKGTSSTLGGDLDYTLRAYPNHHRALLSLERLAKRTKSAQPPGMHYTVECYFERAIRFRPDDSTARMIYAIFLFDNARPADADRQLEQADKLSTDNGFTQYNMGLIYFEHNQFDKAVIQAQKAYSLGFPRPDLYNKLKAAGKWTGPEPRVGESAATAASSPASAASDVPK